MIIAKSCNGEQCRITELHLFIAMRPEDSGAKEKLPDPIR